ncbi:hypothetical protein LTR84_006039 [Exophiala bonariae]|uniref:Uncharacterized protein n=1 Tax=Exophiala bonariae TaxID=1690606 RepID=A0AAV9N2P8_9EURO|nr:hypothetical protein LTR84_006039 [Exophiala bonariae]
MLFTKAALTVSSLILLVAAQEPDDAFYRSLKPSFGRTPTTTSRLLKTRDLDKRCTGSCEECFGDGYTLCPGSSIYCYLPGDSSYGLDSCSSDYSSDSTSTASAPASTSTAYGTDELCYQTGATCTSCFGPTYLDCPDGYHCYDPNDPLYDTCPEDDDSSDTTSSGSGSTCADVYGSGSIPCGDDSCYNPGDGDVCCDDGYHCEDGYTCSSISGKCCAPGSTSSSCSGSGSGLLSSSSIGATRTTSSSGLTFNTGTATTSTRSTGTSTGVSQFANGAGAIDVQKGFLLAAGLGALVL